MLRLVQKNFGFILLVILSSFLSARPLLASADQYRELGLRYRQQGRFPAAIAALKKSVELDPQNLSGRVTLGWTLHLAKADQAAADVLQETIQRDPFYVPALNAAGIVYLVNADLVSAVVTHTWAATLAPDNEIPSYNLSLAFQRLEQYPWAIARAERAAELEPNNPHPFVALAIAHWGNGEVAIAQQTYQQAIRLDSRYSNSGFLNNLSQAGFSPDQIKLSRQILRTLR